MDGLMTLDYGKAKHYFSKSKSASFHRMNQHQLLMTTITQLLPSKSDSAPNSPRIVKFYAYDIIDQCFTELSVYIDLDDAEATQMEDLQVR